MLNDHLKDGEMSELFKYFTVQKEPFTTLLNKLIEAVPLLKMIDYLRDLKRIRDTALTYPSRSTYGTNTDEIKTNAGAHFNSCEPCMDKYRSFLEEVAESVRPKEGLFLSIPIKNWDFLEILHR